MISGLKGSFVPRTSSCIRYGEADHPGPAQVRLGVTNPSGLRMKEPVAIDMGEGIYTFCESQLSKFTQQSCGRRLKYLAKENGRLLRAHFSAPAPVRATSTWAGSWTGIAMTSDYPSSTLALPWQPELFSTGRLLATMHYVHGTPLLVAGVYGFAKSPTWPKALELTESLLKGLTHEVVYGARGPRVICGDFNVSPTELETFDTWRMLGWQSVQSWAADRWGQTVLPTCKGCTEVDQVWMSPEALALCEKVEVLEHFSEHSTVVATLQFPEMKPCLRQWPKPSLIPWGKVDSHWPSTSASLIVEEENSDVMYSKWAMDFENSFKGHIPEQPDGDLIPNQRGRARHHQPLHDVGGVRILKPSRPGEAQCRSDLLGEATKKWFQQLRRLQSYKHAAVAAKDSVNAQAYRAELWTAIRRARGFVPDFPTWWANRVADSGCGCSIWLPVAPPDGDIAVELFVTFKEQYEKFEAWHLRQRSQLLRDKHDRTMRALHRELAAPAKQQVDVFWEVNEYQIIEADEETHQLLLDKPLKMGGSSRWFVDDLPVTILGDHSDVCTVVPFHHIGPDSVLIQKQTLAQLDDVQSHLLEFWKQRWLALPQLTDEHWGRVVSFLQNYVPKMAFSVPTLELKDWKKAVGRFGPRAATGVDGVSAADLKHMPESWTSQLLMLLQGVEKGHWKWPRQMSFGTVLALGKVVEAHCPEQFRPVVVFSTCYRTWSGLRARALLDQLEPYMSSEAFGFLRGREATQAWMGLQGIVELAVVKKEELCGFSTDLRKAFEGIPRLHSFFLARHLGVPEEVCLPWEQFLQSCRRAFVVRGYLSEDTDSVVGMPEGDALSVLAMTMLDFAWHRYLQIFCPTITTTSYVDNLGLRGADPTEVLRGVLLSAEFFKLWNLQLDQNKTFSWATSARTRSVLKLAPYECVASMAELGGCMVYDGRLRNAHQIQRLHSLEVKWERLKYSKAPLCLKLASLPIHFWAKALHGAPSCRIGMQHLAQLRTVALRNLRLSKAGVNSMLRLSLSTTPCADPGLYQLIVTVTTFQRMCWKMQSFIENWNTWMQLFQGALGQGPYAKLQEQLSLIHWRMHGPLLYDHDGVMIAFLTIHPDELRTLLHDAWLQFVSSRVAHRKTMHDLMGLDPGLLRESQRGRDALQLALLGSLNAGAFIDQAAHSRYDLTKDGLCRHCRTLDSQEHWLTCPLKEQLRQQAGLADGMLHGTTSALRLHLLPDRNPEIAWFKHHFAGLEASIDYWLQPQRDVEHLFTDGSCVGADSPVPYASWAVVSATQARPLSMGHLPGLMQSAARAEIYAILAAVEWAALHGASIHLWVDSKFVVDSLNYILRVGRIGHHWNHFDLWQRIAEVIECLHVPPQCTWVPSHWDGADSLDAFEDWLHHWNNQADYWAGNFNSQRSESFWHHREKAVGYYEHTKNLLRKLASFYFACAERTKTTPTQASTERESERPENSIVWADTCICLSDALPVDYSFRLSAEFQGHVPVSFVQQVLERIQTEETLATGVYPCSYIEFVFLWKHVGGDFPNQIPATGEWVCRPLERMPVRPTLALMVRTFRKMFRGLGFLVDDPFGSGWDKTCLGINVATSGIFLGLSSELVRQIRQMVLQFTSNWPIRTARDLARPF